MADARRRPPKPGSNSTSFPLRMEGERM
jgi:hypothetical protein